MNPRAIRRLKMIAWLRDGGMCLDCMEGRDQDNPECTRYGGRGSETHEIVHRNYGDRVWRIENILSLCSWHHRLCDKQAGAHTSGAKRRHLELLERLYGYRYTEQPWIGILGRADVMSEMRK